MADKKKTKSNKEKIDPYFLSNGKLRSEFSPDFEKKRSKIITPEGLYGTASGKTMFEPEIMSPDDSMLVQYQQDGGLMDQPHLNYMGAAKGKFIAKGCGKVMSDRRKKTKMY